MKRPRLLKWLHRFGYVATVIILLELVLISYSAIGEWWRWRGIRAELIEQTRTHESPLPAVEHDNVAKLLRPLPALNALNGNGLRFAAMPYFGGVIHALTLSHAEGPGPAEGFIAVTTLQEGKNMVHIQRFTVPQADYSHFTTQFDRLTDGWSGAGDGVCLDGTEIAFERVRGTRTTSGRGNCEAHYNEVRLLVQRLVRRFAPGAGLALR
jgi:hypothetical protein